MSGKVLDINGKTTINGPANYDKFSCNGLGKVVGPLNVSEKLEVCGMCTFNGDVNCNTFEVDGVGKFIGELTAEKGEVNGICKVLVVLECKDLEINGTLKVEELIDSSVINVSGVVKAKEINTDEMIIDGVLKVSDNIYAEKLDVQSGIINTKKIEGGEIIIGDEDNKLGIGFNLGYKYNKIEEIKAKTVKISSTKVQNITADDVYIGPNCKVDTVIYKNNYNVHPNSSVGKVQKVEE